jgi:hypothetical protein
MTPYELLDLAQSAFSNATANYAVFLSVVTGYLITAYLIGAELTQAQVRLLTALFLVVAVILIWSMSAYVFWGERYSTLARPDGVQKSLMAPQPWMPVVLALVNILTVTACLFFMWNVRYRKRGGTS